MPELATGGIVRPGPDWPIRLHDPIGPSLPLERLRGIEIHVDLSGAAARIREVVESRREELLEALGVGVRA